MQCIAVINQKGGCGKTTISINLAACLADRGKRTLLVDMDPQSHCAVGLAVPEDQIEKNIYDVLISGHTQSHVELKHIVWQISPNFDLAPSGIELAALESQLAGEEGRENCLSNVLSRFAGDYEYVIVDCPPGVGLLMFNALRAADEVLIPVETGYFALHGLSRQIETLEVLRQQCKQDIRFHVLASLYDVRTKLAREVLNELKKNFKAELLQTVINFNTKLKEAASFGQPISEYDPASKGMRDFENLADELLSVSGSPSESRQAIASMEMQWQAIEKNAEEIAAQSRELIGENPVPVQEKQKEETLQQKLDSFYGVRLEEGKVRFAALYPQAQTVQLAGDFNGWKPESTSLVRQKNNGRWEVELPLSSGRYHYRYVVDGRWQQDPYHESCEANPFGEYNSGIEVH